MLETVVLSRLASGLEISTESTFQYSEQAGPFILSRMHLPGDSLTASGLCAGARFEVVTESVISGTMPRTVAAASVFPERVAKSSPSAVLHVHGSTSVNIGSSPFFGQLLAIRECGEEGVNATRRGIIIEWRQPAAAGVHRIRYGVRRLGIDSDLSPSLHTPAQLYVRRRTLIDRETAAQQPQSDADVFGSAASLLTVPDLSPGVTAMTDPVFKSIDSEPPNEYRLAVAGYRDFVPSSFSPGSDMNYSAVLLNISTRASRRLRLESVVLHEDRIIDSRSLVEAAQMTAQRYKLSGTFHIPNDAPDGQYLLGIAALEGNSGSESRVIGWADFQVRKP